MGHYDYRYEEFTIAEADEEIEQLQKRVQEFTDKKVALTFDLDRVIYVFTKNVLEEKRRDVERYLDVIKTKLSRWEQIKSRIENGEDMTWEQAWNIIDS